MKTELLRANETAIDSQIRLTLAAMARATSLPADAWTRFDAKLRQMADKPLAEREAQ
jgi:hypothetical protein